MNKKTMLGLMGKIVTVHSIYKRVRENETNKRYWKEERLEASRAGWVVGFASLQNGVYHSGGSYGGGWEEPEDYESAYLEVESTTKALKVVWWPNRKPVFVPMDSRLEMGGIPDCREYLWDERAKAWMREDSKKWPRDKNGRWIK